MATLAKAKRRGLVENCRWYAEERLDRYTAGCTRITTEQGATGGSDEAASSAPCSSDDLHHWSDTWDPTADWEHRRTVRGILGPRAGH